MSKRGILDIIHFLESDSAEETLQEIANALSREKEMEVKISAEINEEDVIELTQKLGYSSADEDVTVDVSVVTVCAVHRQNAYTHFCEDHDTSVCRDCINENHKECKRVAPITDKAATTKEDIFQCKQEAGRLKETLIEESTKTNKLFSDLQTEEMEKNRYVEQMKADFDKKLKEERRRIEEERISRCIKSNRCLIDQQKKIENVKKQVKALEDVTSKDAVTQFLQVEVTKKAIKPINEEIPKIKKAVSDLSKEIKPVVAYVETDSIVDIPLRLSAYHFSDLSLTYEHDKDLGERWITGCLVEKGILILCDRLQGSVLLFSTLKDKSECFELQLDSPPYGICIAKTPDDRTFFITMPTLEKYAKVTVDSSYQSLSIKRPYLSTGGECYGIASDKENNRVFITCYNKTKGGCIEVRNINNGELLRKIGKNILYWPKQVRITKYKGKYRLFVADSQDNNVVCFSEDGWPEFKIRADGNPSDFFVKDDGDVVVCASTMHELTIISQNRPPIVILRQEDGLFHPTSIALSGKWLVVGMMNKLKLYTID